MNKLRYLLAIFAFLISPYAFAHGDIKFVMYSIAIGFQLLSLIIILIWGN